MTNVSSWIFMKCPQRNELYRSLTDLEKGNLDKALDYKVNIQWKFKAIIKIKKWKGRRSDLILNEIWKAGQTALIYCFKKLFNLVLEHGLYPKVWCDDI